MRRWTALAFFSLALTFAAGHADAGSGGAPGGYAGGVGHGVIGGVHHGTAVGGRTAAFSSARPTGHFHRFPVIARSEWSRIGAWRHSRQRHGYYGWGAPWYGWGYGLGEPYPVPVAAPEPLPLADVAPEELGPPPYGPYGLAPYRACRDKLYRVPSSTGGRTTVRVTRC